MKIRWVALLIVWTCYCAPAQVFTFTPPSPRNIPDNQPGIFDLGTISGVSGDIEDINVHLDITGDFNGDLYVYLAHDTGIAVLLNRVGRRAGSGIEQFGYSDSGFDATFDDSATANGDVHNYRVKEFGSHTGGVLVTPLTGSWEPDARNEPSGSPNPATTLDTDARTQFLSEFNTLNPNGDWTLFLQDFSPGGTSILNSWSVEVTAAVPEPGESVAAAAALCLIAAGFMRFRRRTSSSWRPRDRSFDR